ASWWHFRGKSRRATGRCRDTSGSGCGGTLLPGSQLIMGRIRLSGALPTATEHLDRRTTMAPKPLDMTKEAFRAARSGNAADVKQIVAADPSALQARDADGATLLHHAAWKGHPEVAALLIELGAEVDAQSSNSHWGGTPLHAAAHGNQRKVAELLLQAGADPQAVSCNGRTPREATTLHNAI